MRRGGFALSIPLVFGLLGLVITLAAVQLFRTSGSLRGAARNAGGAVAESLATSAIEEALWIYQTAVNDPEHPLFRRLREALIAGERGTIDLSEALRPTRLPRLMADSADASLYRRLEIVRFHATMRVPMRGEAIAAGRAAEAVLAGEQFLDLDCGVRLDLNGTPVYRHVMVRRRYGVTFISPYKPFDKMSFAIIRSGFLGTYPALVAQVAGFLRQLDDVGRFLGALTSQLAEDPPPTSLSARATLLRLGAPPTPGLEERREIARALARRPPREPARTPEEVEAQRWDDRTLLPGGATALRLDRPYEGPTAAVTARWLRVRRDALIRSLPAEDAVIHSFDAQVELPDFDYEARVERDVKPRLEALRDAVTAYNQAVHRFATPSPGPPVDLAEVRRFLGSADRFRAALTRELLPTLEELNKISRHVNKHTTLGLSAGVFRGYLDSASRRLRNLAYHADSRVDVLALQADLPAFNGHVNYNHAGPVDLSMTAWRGKSVISAPWRNGANRVTVRAFTTEDRGRDLAVLNFPDLTLGGGAIEAGVYVHRALRFDGSPQIHGNLILQALPTRQERDRDTDLRGRVRYDPRLASGPFWKREPGERPPPDLAYGRYTIGLAPRGGRRAVFRSEAALQRAIAGGAS